MPTLGGFGRLPFNYYKTIQPEYAGVCVLKVIDCGNTVMVYASKQLYFEEIGGESVPVESVGKMKFPGGSIQKLNSELYVNKLTGEVKEFKHQESKGDNLNSVRSSYGRMKAIINCNYETPEQVLFWTLTYQECMTDYKRVSKDMFRFLRLVRKHLYKDFQYVYVKELQSRGAWHVHMLTFHPVPIDKPPCKVLVAGLWGQGLPVAQDCRGFSGDINNLGQYVSPMFAYHGDQSDKLLRLAGIESGAHLWSCSRGIKRPVVYDMPDSVAESFLSERGCKLRSSHSYSFAVDSDCVISGTRTLYNSRVHGFEVLDNSGYVKYLKATY